jgi:hypothetical protein
MTMAKLLRDISDLGRFRDGAALSAPVMVPPGLTPNPFSGKSQVPGPHHTRRYSAGLDEGTLSINAWSLG